jgi:hypothetical protein
MARVFDGAVEGIERLELGALPVGREGRFMVELTRDGMGMPVRAPMVTLRGKKAGPTLGIVAALHGNEVNGVRTIHDLFDRVDPATLRGTIVALVVANVPGFLLRQREYLDGTDLNHIMPGREGGSAPQVYAHRLVDRVVSKFDYLIDLHTASFGRVNALYIRADMSHAACARMTYTLRPQIILHNPASEGTLRDEAMDRGIPGVTVEIGDPHRFQPEMIKRTVTGLRAVLAELGMAPARQLAPGPEPVMCSSSAWMYTKAGGLLDVSPRVTARVEAGERLATLRDVFGDVVERYEAPHDGVVIGKAVEPVAPTGARILHLGVVAAPDDKIVGREATSSLRKG